MAQHTTPKPKARGALFNKTGRFEAYEKTWVDDGWGGDDDNAPRLVTEVRTERARSLISYNKSPDLPFDRSINPYRGCEHGCVYCFARPSHAYLGLSPGLDFETRLIMRPNAPEVLRRELASRTYRPATLAIGTNTDPYQPIERDAGIMRACLEVLLEARHPVAVTTKGTLIERDLDVLTEMANHGLVRVGVSVTSLDADLSRRMEPRAPSPKRRLKMIENLSAAGVPVRVMASPMVPGLSDHELEGILAAGADARARYASWIMLRLPGEVSELWQDWLAEHYPNRAGRVMARLCEMHGGKAYDARWNHRMRGTGEYAEMVQARFRLAIKRLGLSETAPPLSCDLFKAPPQLEHDTAKRRTSNSRQLSLF